MNQLDAISGLASRLRTVGSKPVSLGEATGRFLAESLTADRDSPAADVSAMDGYAIRRCDAVAGQRLQVVGVSKPGSAPPPTPAPGQTLQIFTGAVVPDGCDLVVRREDVSEGSKPQESVELLPGRFAGGMNIRRRGENAVRGSTILAPGTLLGAAQIAAAANFGAGWLNVARPVRVATIVTGDELRTMDDEVAPWQLRDSNGPTLASLMQKHPWIEVADPVHVDDEMQDLVGCIRESVAEFDAILLTGGVSMGGFDFVPAAVREAGATVVFHKLAIRPGKPILGAAGPDGQLILGLPGNPVSAAVGAARFGLPLISKMAGADPWPAARPRVELADPGDKSIPLTWFRLVRIEADGRARLVPGKGSGDLVSLAHSDGFIEQSPDALGPGPWPYWAW